MHEKALRYKWFVQAVSSGRPPAEVIAHKDQLLEFCMSNVYEALTEDARLVLNTILASRSEISEAEIMYYSGLESLVLRTAMINLLSTSFVIRKARRNKGIEECVYSIEPMAKEFLAKSHPPETSFITSITKKKKELIGAVSRARNISTQDEFSLRALTIRNPSERIAAMSLQKALRESRNRNYDTAIEHITKAKAIAPNYSEVYRISGFVKAHEGNVIDAESDYRIALELEPSNPRLLFFYGGFLLRYPGFK